MNELRLNVRVVGIANSKRALVKNEGVDLDSYASRLGTADEMSVAVLADTIIGENLRNSIFVDVTAVLMLWMSTPAVGEERFRHRL